MIGIPWTRIKCSAVHNVLYDILSFQIKYGFFVDLTLILAILIRIVGWLLPLPFPKKTFFPLFCLFVCLFIVWNSAWKLALVFMLFIFFMRKVGI